MKRRRKPWVKWVRWAGIILSVLFLLVAILEITAVMRRETQQPLPAPLKSH